MLPGDDIITTKELARLMNERDRLYEAKFKAADTAVVTALTAQKLAIDIALAAADRAVTKSEVATERRFESVNEFRALVNDIVGRFISRIEVEDKLKSHLTTEERLIERIQALEQANANLQGRFWAIGVGFTLLSSAIAIALHFIGK